MDFRGLRETAPFQGEAGGFMFERDHSQIFARPGTGKTLAALLAAYDWIDTGAAKRVMVTAPLKVAKNVWMQVRDKWEVPLDMALLTGETKFKEGALRCGSHLLICNNENLPEVLISDHGCNAMII